MSVGTALVIDEMDGAERAAIISLWERCGLTRPWNDPVADVALAERTESATVLVARREGRIVGAAMTGHDGHRGVVYYLGVDPDARRAGWGRRLVAACEAWCRAAGVPKINLLVRKENAGVLAFYEALGWRDTDTVCLYRTVDPERSEVEARMKAEWAAKVGRPSPAKS